MIYEEIENNIGKICLIKRENVTYILSIVDNNYKLENSRITIEPDSQSFMLATMSILKEPVFIDVLDINKFDKFVTTDISADELKLYLTISENKNILEYLRECGVDVDEI